MTPIKFKEHNIVFAKNQPEYLQLPAYHDKVGGRIFHCWRLTWKEKLKILFTGKLWIKVLTFNNPPQPILPGLDSPFKNIKEG